MGGEFGVGEGEHVPGPAVHEYLTAYAKKWNLPKRISLRTAVIAVEKAEDDQGGHWRLTIQSRTLECGDGPAESTITTRKLIVATGVTSNPHEPDITGRQQFDAPIIHSAALGLEQGRLLDDPAVQTVAVLGGGKSAYDAVYLAASAGRNVVWLMRRSGRGPAWIFPPHTNLGPFKALREVRDGPLEGLSNRLTRAFAETGNEKVCVILQSLRLGICRWLWLASEAPAHKLVRQVPEQKVLDELASGNSG
jgi:cation diffusion facilitator CzcD-associated flavoprotein CzcO